MTVKEGGKATKKAVPPRPLADAPQLVTAKEVAVKFGVTAAGLRKWSVDGEFPRPHVVIGRMWFWRADHIEHKLRTGNWPPGVKFDNSIYG